MIGVLQYNPTALTLFHTYSWCFIGCVFEGSLHHDVQIGHLVPRTTAALSLWNQRIPLGWGTRHGWCRTPSKILMKKKHLLLSVTGRETHGGPRGHWPPDFPNSPPVFEEGAQRAPKFFEPPTYKHTCLDPGFWLGPPCLKDRGPIGLPPKILSFEPWC